MKKTMLRQKSHYDKKMAANPFNVGDAVWLHCSARKKGRSPKLQCRWRGPYIVVKRLSDLVYCIQKSSRAKSSTVHFENLKPYKGAVDNEWVFRKAVETDIPEQIQLESDLEEAELDKAESETEHAETEILDDMNQGESSVNEKPSAVNVQGRPLRHKRPPNRYGWS